MKNVTALLFATAMGISYLAFGVMQVATVIPDLAVMAGTCAIPADPLGGLILCIIGLVFLMGTVSILSGKTEGDAFLFVGMLLSLGFGLIALLTIGAGWLDAVLFGEPGDWSASAVAVPMFYLSWGALGGYRAWGRHLSRGLARA
jgi:hypothetical protein